MAAIEHQPTHSRAAVDTATATLKAHAPCATLHNLEYVCSTEDRMKSFVIVSSGT
jgi:hypothetical protein